jgi:hypothetical protein
MKRKNYTHVCFWLPFYKKTICYNLTIYFYLKKFGDFFQKIIEFATLNFTPKNETATNPGQFVI